MAKYWRIIGVASAGSDGRELLSGTGSSRLGLGLA
jgi:hypothetical protein